MGHLSTGVAFQPFSSIDLLQASERLRRSGNRVALRPCLCCLLDKSALRGHMWTTRCVAHMHPPGANFPQGLRLRPDALRLPGYRLIPFSLDSQQPGPSRRTAARGAAQGVGGGTPHAVERLRRGRDAGGSRRPQAATAAIRPLVGV